MHINVHTHICMRPTFTNKILLFIWYSYFIGCPVFVLAELSELYLNANFNQSLSQLEGSNLNLLQNAKGPVASGRDSRRSPGLGESKKQNSDPDQSRESHFPALGLSFIICTVRGIGLNYLYSPVQLQCLCYFWLFRYSWDLWKAFHCLFSWCFTCGKNGLIMRNSEK